MPTHVEPTRQLSLALSFSFSKTLNFDSRKFIQKSFIVSPLHELSMQYYF